MALWDVVNTQAMIVGQQFLLAEYRHFAPATEVGLACCQDWRQTLCMPLGSLAHIFNQRCGHLALILRQLLAGDLARGHQAFIEALRDAGFRLVVR